MTVVTAWRDSSGIDDQSILVPGAAPQRLLGGVALAGVAAMCAWTICASASVNHTDALTAAPADQLALVASRGDKLAVAQPLPELAAALADAASFDSRFAAAFPSGVFLGGVSIASNNVMATPATPTARRTRPAPPQDRRFAHRFRPNNKPAPANAAQQPQVATAAPADQPTLFERIFGRSQSSIFAKLFGPAPDKVELAYASPTDGVAGDSAGVTAGLYDRHTAVYDIAAHTVYMPDGTTLEAHSGLGSRLDDPRYVGERDRGATPPDIYDLAPRGALFHGVQALRLIPVDETRVYGRAGLLAHSYMLGSNGQSNGCVSFKDYDAFLQAYANHEVTRLAVVSHVD
jgi:Protein of unknown function (DUF2778)